jgi:acetoin utilization protein AcuC
MTTPHFYYSDEMMRYNMGAQHPMKPIRLQMTKQLLDSYGLFDKAIKLIQPELADTDEAAFTHSWEFLTALSSINRGEDRVNLYKFGLGTGDNPVFADIYEASLRYCGASIQAAQAVIDGQGSVAFNISGGLHHAHYDRAAGFCVLNDCAMAARRLRTHFRKVAYVDIDVHHGDGVQELFYADPTVLTVSIHEVGRGFFPGTGYVDEIGEGLGEGYSVNVPVAPDTTDETWLMAWRQAALPILKAFKPEAIVLQMGADPHYLDPLAQVCLTVQGWLEAVRDVHALGLPIVAIGGGGYNLNTVTRMWASAVSVLIDHPLPNEVPQNYAYQSKIPFLLDDQAPDVSSQSQEYAHRFALKTVEDVKSALFARHGL